MFSLFCEGESETVTCLRVTELVTGKPGDLGRSSLLAFGLRANEDLSSVALEAMLSNNLRCRVDRGLQKYK